jgi:hypothetical protein
MGGKYASKRMSTTLPRTETTVPWFVSLIALYTFHELAHPQRHETESNHQQHDVNEGSQLPEEHLAGQAEHDSAAVNIDGPAPRGRVGNEYFFILCR